MTDARYDLICAQCNKPMDPYILGAFCTVWCQVRWENNRAWTRRIWALRAAAPM